MCISGACRYSEAREAQVEAPIIHHYLIVRADLGHPAQAVYIAHAAGESNPRCLRGMHVVILTVPDAPALVTIGKRLALAGVEHVLQLADNGDPMTIGCLPGRKEDMRRHLSSLPLLK